MTSSEGSPSSVGETEKNKRKRVFLFFSARLRVDGGKKRASGTSRLGVVLATATPKSMARSRFLGRGSFRVHRTGSDCFASFVFALKKIFFCRTNQRAPNGRSSGGDRRRRCSSFDWRSFRPFAAEPLWNAKQTVCNLGLKIFPEKERERERESFFPS